MGCSFDRHGRRKWEAREEQKVLFKFSGRSFCTGDSQAEIIMAGVNEKFETRAV